MVEKSRIPFFVQSWPFIPSMNVLHPSEKTTISINPQLLQLSAAPVSSIRLDIFVVAWPSTGPE